MEYTVSILYGSTREDRKGIRAARYLEKKMRDMGNTIHFIDPVEIPLPLLNKMYKEYPEGNAPDNMEKIATRLKESDGFLVVTGEYNHGVPPALKNLLDHFQKEYFFKPSAIACYSAGSYGGVRAAIQLRIILAELGMSAIPTIQAYPKVQDAFSPDGKPLQNYIDKSTKRFLDEFDWYLSALKKERENGTPY
ncbi:MAG: NADPH-dependent FMN reductase [Cyclobacteriaceae bacterium]